MDFTIWKVELGQNLTRGPWFTYSIRERPDDQVIILDERQFTSLFPKIPTDLVPIAPKTGVITIEAELK